MLPDGPMPFPGEEVAAPQPPNDWSYAVIAARRERRMKAKGAAPAIPDQDVKEVSIPLAARLDYLAALEEGWLDGEGKKITQRALATARLICPNPRLYPTEVGGISVEWDDYYGHGHGIEIQPNGRIIIWEAVPDD